LGNWLKIGVLISICLIPLFTIPAFAESDVVIFQVEPYPSDGEYSWIKLYNPSENPVSLSGWEITTTEGGHKEYTLSGSIKACDFKKITLESVYDYNFDFMGYGSIILYDNNRKIVHLVHDTQSGWLNDDVSLSCYRPETQKQVETEYLENGCPVGFPYIWSDGLCYSSREIPVEMGFYSNEAYEFAFEAPTNWKYRENVGAAQIMIFPSLFNPLGDLGTPKIIVVFENISELQVPSLSGRALENYHIDKIKSEEFTGGKIISTDVEDNSWGWVVSTEFYYLEDLGLGSSLQLHSKQKAFHFKDREFYTIAYFATDDYYDTYLSVYDHVIDTAVIKGVKVPEFQEIAMVVLASSIVLVVLFARKFKAN